jgi:hypothetical protein
MIQNPESVRDEEADLWNQKSIKILHQKAKKRKFHFVSKIDEIRLSLANIPNDSNNNDTNYKSNRIQNNEDSKQTNDSFPKRHQKKLKDNPALPYVFLIINIIQLSSNTKLSVILFIDIEC